MKTKFNITVGGFTLNKEVAIVKDQNGAIIDHEYQPVQIPKTHIEGEFEYSVAELRDSWKLVKEITEESPEVFKNFAIKLFDVYKEVEETIAMEVASDENN